MSILSRFGDIMAANINAMLDKAEDPSKMIDQYLRKASEDLAQVKQETTGVMAQEKTCKQALDAAKADVAKYTGLAEKAIMAGNDDDARVFLSKKQQAESSVASAQASYDLAHANAEKMRQMYDKLVEEIKELNARREQVKATVAVAKTTEKVNKAQNAMNGAQGAISNISRMEAKANDMLARAQAEAELNQSAMTDEATELEKKYGAGGNTSVDDELARMKAALAAKNGNGENAEG